MNKTISIDNIRELANLSMALWANIYRKGAQVSTMPIISLYLPTHRGGAEKFSGKDAIRMKNMLQQVRREISDYGYNIPEEKLNSILQPAEQLLDDSRFWRERSEGLALFIGENLFEYYTSPISFEERLVIDEACYLLPLMSVVNSGSSEYFILVASQQHVRLLEASQYSVREIKGFKAPRSTENFIKPGEGESTPSKSSGREYMVDYHKHGGEVNDFRDVDIVRFFQEMRDGLNEVLYSKRKNVPLLFAGVEYLFPLFKETCNYPHLIKDRSLQGNFDLNTPEEIHEKSLSLMQDYFNKPEMQMREMIENVAGTGITSDNPEEIVRAVMEGRVQCLFVNEAQMLWGQINPDTFEARVTEQHTPFTVDFVNYAALQTILKGGNVFVTHQGDQLPSTEDRAMVALYRY